MAIDPATVAQPKHPLHALATFELKEYCRQLERAIAHYDGMDPVPRARDDLQARLDDVMAEQESRTSPGLPGCPVAGTTDRSAR